MTKLIVNYLSYCGYSQHTVNTIKRMCENKKRIELIEVNDDKKDYYKMKNKMNTFPQIFLEHDGESIKIGGDEDFQKIVSIIQDAKKNKKKSKDIIDKIGDKLGNCSKRAKLELISILLDCK